jgi:hypothetical protein
MNWMAWRNMSMLAKPKRKAMTLSMAVAIVLAGTLAISGCSLIGGSSGTSSSSGTTSASASASDGSGNENTSKIQTTTSSAYAIKVGAQNPMVDDALQMTVTNVERRPVSTFTNAMSGSDGTSSSDSSSNTNDSSDDEKVAIEVDISYTYNPTTLKTNVSNYGGEISQDPDTLSDVLLLGELMYITGEDATGSKYVSTDVLSVATGSSDSSDNTLGTNAQWDYDVLNSQLPQAAQTKTGSIIFTVSSTARNLTLHIITGHENANPLDAESVGSGNNYNYTLDLS